jgi:hypothetical protein
VVHGFRPNQQAVVWKDYSLIKAKI